MNGLPIIGNLFFEVLVFDNFSALTFVNLSWALSSVWKDSWVALLSDFVKMFFETFAVICDRTINQIGLGGRVPIFSCSSRAPA